VKIFRGLPRAEDRVPCALTIGNFDGAHLGHQLLLQELCEAARVRRLASCVLTFEPHPRDFFSPQAAPARTHQLRDKLYALERAGVDRLIIARFNARFAVQQASDFIRDVIATGLNTRYLVVGEDFRFGAGGLGQFALLHNTGWKYGFEAHAVPALMQDGRRISSSSLRLALQAGQLELAKRLLGRAYTISGHVLRGAGLGHTLGCPTLNLRIGGPRQANKSALLGVFVVQVHGILADPLPGVASLGTRPTVTDSGSTLLEVHLLDFFQALYGRLVMVEFLHKLRDEMKYPDLDALQAAMTQDRDDARNWFAKSKPLVSPTSHE
jgi:riboflavin kinase/FMN adenylyltransferase